MILLRTLPRVSTEDSQLLAALEDDSVEAHSKFTTTGFDL